MAKAKTVGVKSKKALELTQLANPAVTLGDQQPDPEIVPVKVPEGCLKESVLGGKVRIMQALEVNGPPEAREVRRAFLLDGDKVVAECELVTPVVVGAGHALFLAPGGVIF